MKKQILYNDLYNLSGYSDKWTGYTGTVTNDPLERLLFTMHEKTCKPPWALMNELS